MNFDVVSLLIFVIILSIFLYVKRKNLDVQKILFPLFYLLLYRTKVGLKFIDKVSSKFRELVRLMGYIGIGFSFLGMIYISYGVVALMLKFFMAPATTDTGFALILPGTSIPGIGYLPFWHWIIALVILAVIHEFSHGIVARAHDLKIKSSGFAFLGILVPIIPAAFVEPDEKELVKKDDIVQYSVFAAGPISNLLVALIILLFLPYVGDLSGNTLAPFEGKMTEPVGFSVDILNESLPSGLAGMNGTVLLNSYDGEKVTNANYFIQELSCKKPGDVVNLGNDKKTYSITTIPHPNDDSKAFVGIYNIKNERRVRQEYEWIKGPYYWFKELFKWLFLFNYFIGLINLFPIFITDGARILRIAMDKLFKNSQKAAKVWSFINLLFLLLIIVGLISTYLKQIGIY